MTRKDYVLIATIIKEVKDDQTRNQLALDFSIQLKQDNPRFNTQRFIEACQN